MSAELPLASLFHALGDPSRLRILALVRSMELTVGEIALVLGQSQPRVSRHVRILAEAALVSRRKEGSWVFVEADRGQRETALRLLIDAAKDKRDRDVFQADATRLEAVRGERAEAAGRWFDRRAERWEQLRQLHAPDAQIEAALDTAVGSERIHTLVDVGTGTGRMIELFADRVDRAIGIDRSPDMLRVARVRLDEARIGHASLRQGDMTALPLPDASANLVILHLVLHFAHAPGAAVHEAARLLAPGGRLLVVDFAAHEREELRRLHGHQRLGFSDERIGGWLADCGLEQDTPIELPGRTLVIKIWTARRGAGRGRTEEAA
ncbi:ArsR/SmtB family transcription factor [Sphingomicrobium nitratireducens]|uniref:ArsR/SmtB family transcription factor n=1 Tax=Sphingomicrobium nitratireducens TaxID=2964666 RepID=UPI0022402D5F|nr:metalloregulator ArsR/SmtB family transcription factor [Sphingomicrobium nitratireducens]